MISSLTLLRGGLATCTRRASDRASRTRRRRLLKGVWRVLTICTRSTGTCKPSWASRLTRLGAPCKTSNISLDPLFEGPLETHVKDHLKCWICGPASFLLSARFNFILTSEHTLSAYIDVMVLLRKSNCSCNIL